MSGGWMWLSSPTGSAKLLAVSFGSSPGVSISLMLQKDIENNIQLNFNVNVNIWNLVTFTFTKPCPSLAIGYQPLGHQSATSSPPARHFQPHGTGWGAEAIAISIASTWLPATKNPRCVLGNCGSVRETYVWNHVFLIMEQRMNKPHS